MTKTAEMLNETLQWIGAAFIIGGHLMNSIGPRVYPWNILSFLLGTAMFLMWSLRVSNRPQLVINLVALTIGLVGLYRAIV